MVPKQTGVALIVHYLRVLHHKRELCPCKYSKAVKKNNDKVFSRVLKTNHVNNEHFLRPAHTTKQDERDDTRDLKYIPGKRLPVKVSHKCSTAELKEETMEKHSKYDLQYFVLWEIIICCNQTLNKFFYFPGSSNVFQLDKYKHDFAKPYSQILFYLFILLHFENRQSSSGKINLSPKNLSCQGLRKKMSFYLMNSQIFTEIQRQQIFQYHLATVPQFHHLTHQPTHSIQYIKHHLGTLTKNYQELLVKILLQYSIHTNQNQQNLLIMVIALKGKI